MEFKSNVESIKGVQVIRIPNFISLQLPSRGMVMAHVTINEETKTMALEPDGYQGHYIHLEGYKDQEKLSLKLSIINEWPSPTLPDDFSKALLEADLMDYYLSLTTKCQWAWLRWVRAAHKEQTRTKRLVTMCDMLSVNKKRPCCFDHSQCTEPSLSKNGKLIMCNEC